jgi:hypothetical protein
MFLEKYEHSIRQDVLESLSENGYAVVSRSDTSIQNNILDYYKSKELPNVIDGFYSTMMHSDFVHKKDVNSFLCERLYEFTSVFFRNHKPLFANYLVKSPNSNRNVGLHQDWTYTDENKYHSINVWMPLQPTNALNGGLYVVPRSHKLPFSLRYTPFDEKLYDVDKNLLTQKAVLIETQQGEALIYDSRLLHFSEGNLSDDYRVACAGIFLPDGAPALHYFLDGTIMKEYKTDLDFYCNLLPGEEPSITPSKTYYFSETASQEKIVEFLKNTQHVVEEKE